MILLTDFIISHNVDFIGLNNLNKCPLGLEIHIQRQLAVIIKQKMKI